MNGVIGTKEESYLSVVMICRNDSAIVEQKLRQMALLLEEKVTFYEIIVVDNASTDRSIQLLKALDLPITVIELAREHNGQQAVAAGIDIAVGDFIVEIPDIRVDYAVEDILLLLNKCKEGFDFVFLPPQNTSIMSQTFYKLLNMYFQNSLSTPVDASIMTLSSRRGQNKIADLGRRIINRSVAYLCSGLPCAQVRSTIVYHNRRNLLENLGLMVDTFIFYTNYITRVSVFISLLFFLLSLFGILYGIASYFVIVTVPGWMSTFVLCSAAFSAIFLMLAIVCKYLSHILDISIDSSMYVFRSISKNEKRTNK